MKNKQTLSVLEWAREYRDKGFSVIPIKPKDKAPMIKWAQYQNRLATDKELELWFGNGSENNIGIVTGKISGIDVLDLDSKDSVQYAEENEFLNTPLVKTGKGFHCYCRHKDGVRNFQKRDNLPGIDLRGDGGYVVAPPSIHPSGLQYQWVEGKGLEDVLYGELPNIILAKEPQDKEPLKKLYKGSVEGSRNTNLTRLVGSWVNDGLTFDECMDNARIINMKTNPPMNESEIASIINSILKKENAKAVTLLGSIHNTELGNAQRITNYFGDMIRYCGTLKKWLVYNEQYGAWQIDDNGQVQRLAKETIKNMFREASRIVDSEERRNLIKWGLASESAVKIQAMIKLAESEEGIAVAPADLDLNPWLLNCHNGTIDLRTGQLKEHDKGDLITKSIPVIYDPNAKCPKWLKFLVRIMGGNQELISYLQRAVGYVLTGDIREQCFFTLHGNGANGKSTFIKTIGSLLGDYAQAASFETFLSRKQGNVANNDIARMQGKRFISAVEAEGGRKLAENIIKQVTGGDVITARFLYAEYFEFIPQFKIFLAANHKPKIGSNDSAIWRRVRLIPFNEKITEEEKIDDLDDQLKDELSGILNWSLHGCLDWQEDGLKTPVEVESATKEYRNEMDTVAEFISECCELEPNYKETPTTLYNAYQRNCELNGEKYLSMKEFGKSLEGKGFSAKKTNGKYMRRGIKLLNQDHDFDQVSDKSPVRTKGELEKLYAQL
jgi:putative DNA primase/helicase